jgi:hypothetical protein
LDRLSTFAAFRQLSGACLDTNLDAPAFPPLLMAYGLWFDRPNFFVNMYLLLNLIPIFHSWLMRPHGLSSRVTSNTVFVVQDLHF